MEPRQRRKNRLPGYDYGQTGAYFVTICTKGKKHMFGQVVGADVLIGPHVVLSPCGQIVDNVLSQMPAVDKYVIMPNHLHVIFMIPDRQAVLGGPMRTSAPTVAGLVRYLKRNVTQMCGEGIWQRSFHDHIIRSDADYQRIWEYIDTNPAKWTEDIYFEETQAWS